MTRNDTKTVRCNINLPADLVRRVDQFSASAGCSRTQAVSELLALGLDADTAGVESMMQIGQQIRRDLGSLRGLVVAAIDSADVSAALQLQAMMAAGFVERAEASQVYISARQAAGRLKHLKKQATADA